MTQDRRDALRKGAEPEAGEENIAEYLQTVEEYLADIAGNHN